MTSRPHRHSRQRKTLLTRPRLLILATTFAALGIAGGAYHLLTAKDAEDHLRIAQELVAKGDGKGARIELKNALQKEPGNAEAHYRLGRLYFASQEYPAAEKELKLARDKDHRAPDLLPMLARSLLALREPQRVLAEIDVPAGATADTAASILALRARAQFMLGNEAAAEHTLQEADGRRPNHPDTLMTRAQAALSKGRTDRPIVLIDQAIAADEQRADYWIAKGDILRIGKKREEALAAYRKALLLEPDNLAARLASAIVHIDMNALDLAAVELAAARKTAPDNLIARYLGALIDFRRAHFADANTKLQQVMKNAPDFLPGQLLAGAVNLAMGNRNTAIAHLNRVIERVPEHAYARKLLAAALIQGGNWIVPRTSSANSRAMTIF